MKFRRAIGGVLLFAGCIAAFAGVVAIFLPMLDNEQLRRVLASFSLRDDRLVIDLINRAVSACLRNAYIVAGGGLGLALIGLLLRRGASAPAAQADNAAEPREPAANDASDEAYPTGEWTPHDGAALDGREAARRAEPAAASGRVPVAALSPYQPKKAAPEPRKPAPLTDSPITVPVVQRCPACGENNAQFATFCRRCGTDLPAAITDGDEVETDNDDSAPRFDNEVEAALARADRTAMQPHSMRRATPAPIPAYQPPMRVVADAPVVSPSAAPSGGDAPRITAETAAPESAATFRQPIVGGRAIRMENIARASDAPPVVSDDDATPPPAKPTFYVSINAPYPSPMVDVSSVPPERLPVPEPPRGFASAEKPAAPASARFQPNEPASVPVRLSSRITSTVGVRSTDNT